MPTHPPTSPLLVAGLRRALAALILLVAVVAMAACTVPGTPERVTPQPPIRCSTSSCPELEVFSAKRLPPSGVDKSNASSAVPTYMTTVLNDLESVWQDWFTKLNIEESTAGRVLIEPGTAFQSECFKDTRLESGIASDFPNAFYCRLDKQADSLGAMRLGTVILPVTTFADMWDGKLMGSSGIMLGDFTAATIMAHEYGHNVVYRLVQAYGLPESQEPAGDNTELIADCFAGNWAGTVFGRKDLSFTDMAQAAVLMISIGDSTSGQGHGTSFARTKALWTGFSQNLKRQGQPGDCLKAYWPSILQG